MKELQKYSDDELQRELERRERIKNSDWPKTVKINVFIDFFDTTEDQLGVFLSDECGFHEDSDEYDKAVSGVDASLILEVDRDGNAKVAGITENSST